MDRDKKLLEVILGGRSDKNTRFQDFKRILKALGFSERIRGSHHIYTRLDIAEIINIQPIGNKAKAYQVRQVRGVILKYHLDIEDVD